MEKISFWLLLLVLPAVLINGQSKKEYLDIKVVNEQCKLLHKEPKFGFIDLHNSLLNRLLDLYNENILVDSHYFSKLEWIKKTGLKLVFMSICVPRISFNNENNISIVQVISFLREFRKFIKDNSDQFVIVETTYEAIKQINSNKICIVLAIEGLSMIKDDIRWLDSLYDAGVRMIGIGHIFSDKIIINKDIYNNKYILNENWGLSAFGETVIDILIEKGVLIDLSHLGKTSFIQSIKYINKRQPILVSHSGSKTIENNFRNLDDDQLSLLNINDGIVGVIFHSEYLCGNSEAIIDDFKKHYFYIQNKLTINSVYIGSDLGGSIIPFKNWQNVFHGN